jgi:hypothetical protein
MGCADEVEVTKPGKTLPVVYGVLCPQDSVHRILVRRSFLCKDSIDFYAGIPDSLYFKELEINLELRSNKGFVLDRFTFLPETIMPRDEGIFASEPNILYSARNLPLLMPNSGEDDFSEYDYFLTIYIPELNTSVTAETHIPPNLNLSSPRDLEPFCMDMIKEETLNFIWLRSFTFDLEFIVKVNFEEEINGEWQPAQVHYRKWSGHIPKGFSMPPDQFILTGEWFYTMMTGRVSKNKAITARRFRSIDFEFITIDPIFSYYYYSTHYQTDYNEDTFSNIVNGQGLFCACCRRQWNGFTITGQSLDSLANGCMTRHLKFVRW